MTAATATTPAKTQGKIVKGLLAKGNATASAPVFKVASVMDDIAELQALAIDYGKVETKGRKALNDVLGKIYAHYFAVKKAEKVEQMRTQLKLKIGDKAKDSKADLSNLFVQCVFREAYPKQWSVWAAAIRGAYGKDTAANAFAETVEATEGGLGGLIDTKAATKAKTTLPRAISIFENIDSELQWAEGEEYKLVVAFKGEDGSLVLKEAPIEQEQKDALIVSYARAKEALDKAGKADKPVLDRVRKAELNVRVSSLKLDISKLLADQLKVRKDKVKSAELQEQIDKLEDDLVSAKALLKEA